MEQKRSKPSKKKGIRNSRLGLKLRRETKLQEPSHSSTLRGREDPILNLSRQRHPSAGRQEAGSYKHHRQAQAKRIVDSQENLRLRPALLARAYCTHVASLSESIQRSTYIESWSDIEAETFFLQEFLCNSKRTPALFDQLTKELSWKAR